MSRRFAKGFTLLELMIVVVIIAILASLAYYNYSRFAFRTRRADGREMVMRIAAAQERFFTNTNTYVTSTAGITNATRPFQTRPSRDVDVTCAACPTRMYGRSDS